MLGCQELEGGPVGLGVKGGAIGVQGVTGVTGVMGVMGVMGLRRLHLLLLPLLLPLLLNLRLWYNRRTNEASVRRLRTIRIIRCPASAEQWPLCLVRMTIPAVWIRISHS